MPCHGCAKNFSFFVKELSCAKCGFSFCSKCLKEKLNINGKSQEVCSNCFKMHESNDVVPKSLHDPPALLLKRLETLENPAKPPITIFKHKDKLSNLKVGLDPQDKEIIERLEKLKEGRKEQNPPSENELKRRLMILKGVKEGESLSGASIVEQPKKTQQEQVDDLLNQYMEESLLGLKENKEREMNIQDIETRLKNLHTCENSKQAEIPRESYETDGDAVTRRLIEKAIAEGRLERKMEEEESKDDSDDQSMDLEEDEDECEELVWCIICNENATVKCLDCDGSLYCTVCFQNGHQYFGMTDHKKVDITNKETSLN